VFFINFGWAKEVRINPIGCAARSTLPLVALPGRSPIC